MKHTPFIRSIFLNRSFSGFQVTPTLHRCARWSGFSSWSLRSVTKLFYSYFSLIRGRLHRSEVGWVEAPFIVAMTVRSNLTVTTFCRGQKCVTTIFLSLFIDSQCWHLQAVPYSFHPKPRGNSFRLVHDTSDTTGQYAVVPDRGKRATALLPFRYGSQGRRTPLS